MQLTTTALGVGFRAIDTANQRKHYHEAGVGEALRLAFEEGMTRESLFIQTKFTHIAGQDDRLPYNPEGPVAQQVEQSFQSSLEHLGLAYLDSYLLHGPSAQDELTDEDWEAWRAMETIQQQGLARVLGISNVRLGHLQQLLEHAEVPPAYVQNRCFAVTGWDQEVRSLCKAHGIHYQGFSLLTANRGLWEHPQLFDIASELQCTTAQLIYRFALEAGMIVLTGTTSQQHMREALASRKVPMPTELFEQLLEVAKA